MDQKRAFPSPLRLPDGEEQLLACGNIHSLFFPVKNGTALMENIVQLKRAVDGLCMSAHAMLPGQNPCVDKVRQIVNRVGKQRQREGECLSRLIAGPAGIARLDAVRRR